MIRNACATAICMTGMASAQCQPSWFAGPPDPLGGVWGSAVGAIETYDSALFATVTAVGNGSTAFMKWDGAEWAYVGLPPHPSGKVTVLAMTNYGGKLVAGGAFGSTPDQIKNVAIFDGESWQPLGSGIPINGGSIPVRSLTEFGDALAVGGDFASAGGVSANNIALWDGAMWHALGDGLTMPVGSLATHEGLLIASGNGAIGGNDNLAVMRWTGTSWESLNAPVVSGETTSTVLLADHAGTLYLAVGILPGGAMRTYRFKNEAWELIEAANVVSGPTSLRSIQGHLYLAAMPIGGLANNGLGRLEGNQWKHLGQGTQGPVSRVAGFEKGLLVTRSDVANVFLRWACECPADCDADGSLSVNDYACFQTLFVTGSLAADCDASGALSIDDFVCFQTSFAIGC
jgi:hypothetical protein